MAKRWAHIRAELLAGAPSFDDGDVAFDDAQAVALANGEPRVLVQLVAEVKRDPKPPVIVTRYE